MAGQWSILAGPVWIRSDRAAQLKHCHFRGAKTPVGIEREFMKQIITIRGELVSRLGAILAGPKLFILRYVDAISCPNRTRTATETDAARIPSNDFGPVWFGQV